MSKRYSDFRYLLLIIYIVLALGFLSLAWATPPEIYSITPYMGGNNVPTQITIDGSGFQPTPKVALFGGGPYIIGSANMQVFPKGIYVGGNYAYVADGYSGFQVIDISDPENPGIVGSCDTPGSAHDVYVTGTYAYVANWGSGLQVIDISDPENPSIVGSCDTPGSAHDVYVTGNYAYVADWGSGLQVIDISDPENPGIVGSCDTPASARGIYVAGTYAYVATSIFDVWREFTTSGLQVIDISDPENPDIVGSSDTPDDAWGVYITGTYAYVADEHSGLKVIDISNPKNPKFVGSCDTPGNAFGVYVTDTYVYMADGGSGLQVIEKFSTLTDIQYMDSSTLITTIPAGNRPGTYNLHVTNPDSGHTVLQNAFTIHDGNINHSPEFDHIGNKTINEGALLHFTITATDHDTDNLTFAAINLPFKANFISNTQEFSWVPGYNQSGSYQVTFIVTDNGVPPLSDSETITITVRNKLKQTSWTWDPKRYQYWHLFPDQYQELLNFQLISFKLYTLQLEILGLDSSQESYQYQQTWYQTFYPRFYIPYINQPQSFYPEQYKYWDFMRYQQPQLWNWPE